jgi:hypothetical protein
LSDRIGEQLGVHFSLLEDRIEFASAVDSSKTVR